MFSRGVFFVFLGKIAVSGGLLTWRVEGKLQKLGESFVVLLEQAQRPQGFDAPRAACCRREFAGGKGMLGDSGSGVGRVRCVRSSSSMIVGLPNQPQPRTRKGRN